MNDFIVGVIIGGLIVFVYYLTFIKINKDDKGGEDETISPDDY